METITHQGQHFTLTIEQRKRMRVPVISGEADAWLGVDSDPTPDKADNPNLQALFRLTENGQAGETFSELWRIQSCIREDRRVKALHDEFERERHQAEAERLRWEEEVARATAELAELQKRLEALQAQSFWTGPAKKALDSCTEYGGYKQPPRVVPTAIPKARKAIEQLERDPLQVLLDEIPSWAVHCDNMGVLAWVRILSHRSAGKIEVVPAEYLVECYEQIVDGRVSVDWRKLSEELRFDLGYFVSPSDLAGVELDPEIVQIGDEQCNVKWVIDDKLDVVVTVVTMQLATYQTHKDSLQEIFPRGKLRLRLTLPSGDVVEGEPGDEIARRLAKARRPNKSKRGK